MMWAWPTDQVQGVEEAPDLALMGDGPAPGLALPARQHRLLFRVEPHAIPPGLAVHAYRTL
jgi:hypothetical protein